MRRTLLFTSLLLLPGLADAATLILKRAWIEQFKDRATIDATYVIDHAHPRPNAPSQDGDMHVAGRAPKEIGLPMVAEMMNAADSAVQDAVKLIHMNEGTGLSVSVSGAWRIWFEHPPSAGAQTQFATVPPAPNTNPDHCFEIHPLTKLAAFDVTSTYHDIKGFDAKDPTAAFGAYEKLSLSIVANATSVTLDSQKAGFNYVKFTLHATGKPTKLSDGGVALTADVLADSGEEDDALAHNIRMIFVPGTAPWTRVQSNFGIGDELDVLGIPRVNLNAVSAFVAQSAGSSAVTRKLPYEMIIVALEGK